MLDTIASLFGMSADDIVKLIGAFSVGAATIIGATGKFLANLRGAKKRSFVKIRRLENIIEGLADKPTEAIDPELMALIIEMKNDQRDSADEKDSE